MCEEETQSLSRGVFSFRGKKRKPSVADFVDNSCGLKTRKLSFYNELSSELDKISQAIHNHVSNDFFNQLITYISQCSKKTSEDEIQAAAVITGVNTPDHTILYNNIVSHLKAKVTPYVALIQPTAKAMTLKQVMQSVASQLFADGSVASGPCTLTSLEKWYLKVECGKPSSPRKGQRKVKRPLVFVLEDFASFPLKCMQDLVISCRNHLNNVPIVLVFGVSLSLTSLRNSFTPELSTMLSVESFQMTSSSVHLSTIIDKMLIDSTLPFRLGGKTFQLLLDNFLCQDFSIQKFLYSMQFCVMDHCLGANSPPSSLSSANKLPKMDLDIVRRLMSYRRFVEAQVDPKEQIKLVEDDSYTQKMILRLIERVDCYHRKQPHLLRSLHALVKDLPSCGLGRQLREIYFSVLSEGLEGRLTKAFTVFSNLSREELQERLESAIESLSACPVSLDLSSLCQVLQKLDNFDELLAEKKAGEKSKSVLAKKMDMYTLRKTLQQQKPPHVSLYDDIRTQAIHALHQFYTNELHHYKQLPLHELFYYDEVKMLKTAVNALPRQTVFTALNSPSIYLHEIGELSSSESISSRLPDTSVAFKLHLESGAMINVYDWMQAFISVHESGARDAPDAKQLCARFTHSATEMQLLGFVRWTKRKTDHMTRLTWGSV